MSPPRIGFIGLGRMGRPMASNLQTKGFATLSFDIKLAADHKAYLRVISRYFQRSAAFMVATAIRRLESRQPISAHWKRHWGERGR
jgi:6-phosphogluconate dehydrogenase (decarboxylating)